MITPEPTPPEVAASEGSHDSGHAPFLARHFETPKQQFEAGKLGMWLFLLTEILLFAGLFCAYAVFRANRPDLFYEAHHYLNTLLGAVNTVVLITSSLTMALAVRAAQTDQRRALVLFLRLTLAGGVLFLGIKGLEYYEKWEHGLLPGRYYSPVGYDGPSAAGDTAPAAEDDALPALDDLLLPDRPPFAHLSIFFNIYFLMTGLHAVHVVAGMLAIGWILRRAKGGHFSSHHFGPVDYVGLYWHLVDLIWIFLFPLLYLIH